ncbi:MAG: inositol monophosphatase family protein [Zetaproteobacteria bacterium]|nr:MAG: inositol monophosphatase family protein [Zetaproteobacteria bacterium]
MDHDRTIIGILRSAGQQIIRPALASHTQGGIKGDGSVVTEADLACQQYVAQALAALTPDIAFLGEEMSLRAQTGCIAKGGRYWCLDPLDGTSNFVAGFPMCAISLALIEDGYPVAAYIHDPIRDETFTARRGQGARCNDEHLRCAPPVPPSEAIGFIDFKRLSPVVAGILLEQGHYRSQRNLGSCALEWAWLAAGRAHFIIHGGEKLWDFAAGALLAQESGCVSGDFDARSLFPYQDISSSILACCTPALQQYFSALLNRGPQSSN